MNAPIWLRSASGVIAAACYNGRVAPILVVRGGPRHAETRGNSTSVGRPAEYKTLGKYAGRVFLWLRATNRPGCRAGLRRHGGRKLRTISVGLMAFALASCAPTGGGTSGNEGAEDIQPQILDLLHAGDISACAHPAVIDIFLSNSRMSFAEAHKALSVTHDQYDAAEAAEISFSEISTTKVNKDIAEVQCEANLHAIGQVFPVKYSVRPSSAGDGIVVSYDETIRDAMALAKFSHRNEMSRAMAPAPSVQPVPTQAPDTVVNEEPEPPQPSPPTPYERAQAALGDDSSSSGPAVR